MKIRLIGVIATLALVAAALAPVAEAAGRWG
jgi:hypothetical protein